MIATTLEDAADLFDLMQDRGVTSDEVVDFYVEPPGARPDPNLPASASAREKITRRLVRRRRPAEKVFVTGQKGAGKTMTHARIARDPVEPSRGVVAERAPGAQTRAAMHPPPAEAVLQYRVRDLLRVPGLLSLARVPLTGLFALVAGDARRALGVIALAGLTDVLDGWWARRFHQTSAIGAVADGATDKLFALGAVVTLAVSHRLTVRQAVVLGARELGEALLAAAVLRRADAPARRREQRADVLGKATTAMQFGALALALTRSRATPWVVAATGALGALTAARYARRSL